MGQGNLKQVWAGETEDLSDGRPFPLMVGDKVIISADSDALFGKGIIALLIRVLSNNTAEEIIQSDLYFLDNMGLQENLSMNRASGLESMINQIMSDVEAIRT